MNEEGILVIGESYKLITFDAVADPSTSQAFQERVVSKESVDSIPVSLENPEFKKKNEGSSIHNISKDLIIAALGGIVQKQANEIKAKRG